MSMNSTAAPGLGHGLDISGTTPTPFSRLVRVEMRKAYDTGSGRWLLISTAILTAVVMAIQLAVGISQDDVFLTYNSFLTSTNFSIGLLLPVIGIMLLTSEWSQRTAMVSFSLEPRRPLVIAAKLVVGLALAVVAVAIALVLATICNGLYGALGDDPVVWNAGVAHTAAFVLLQVIGMLTGFAFAALLLNTPAAIVIYMVYSFVLPGLFELGAQLMDWFDRIRPWIDFNYAQGPLVDATMTGKDWAYFAVSGFLWLVIPLAIGVWRVLRAEVK
ncbi:ABC transporter permease subunit [Nocardioides mangrovi]|uniref:ABC transporter permease subunit n=1 Tax=Nocardioides mangrovi TaxID=2874580 RepID=A0ABS7U8Y1_9ACTN|nr:ABC transporter permease subunit [Nocardioides mangrovi]MBZ5737423.1 ABC transporter permease subunit [Nocardioides mangrovi]